MYIPFEQSLWYYSDKHYFSKIWFACFFFLLIINKILWDVRYELVLAFEVLCARTRLTRRYSKAHWMRLLIFTVDTSLTVPDKTSCYGPLLIWVIVINNVNWWIQKVVRLSSSGFINTESSTGNSIWGISSQRVLQHVEQREVWIQKQMRGRQNEFLTKSEPVYLRLMGKKGGKRELRCS